MTAPGQRMNPLPKKGRASMMAIMTLSSRANGVGVLLEINKDETDHVALISSLISRQTGRDADYAAMVPGVD